MFDSLKLKFRRSKTTSTAAPTSPSASNLSTSMANVHTDYGDQVPPHPGARSGWTRFVCISDTHSHIVPVPPGDVLIHAGDLSSWGTLKQLKTTIDWLMTLPHPTKVIVAGNHDLCLDRAWAEGSSPHRVQSTITSEDAEEARTMIRSQAVRNAGIHYLEYESLELRIPSGKVWKIYGSPACPRFAPGCFQYTTKDEAEDIYSRIPPDTEILITHTPPYHTLDQSRKGVRAGCKTLAAKVEQLKPCRLHVFGHIHEANGAHMHQGNPDEGLPDRVSVNGAWGDHSTVIVDLKDD